MKTSEHYKEDIKEGGLPADAHGSEAEIRRIPLVSGGDLVIWAKDQLPLVNCLFVALSLHVVFIPVLWIMGWALPWPKPPVITTVIEYDLTNWPRVAKPKKVFELVDPELN